LVASRGSRTKSTVQPSGSVFERGGKPGAGESTGHPSQTTDYTIFFAITGKKAKERIKHIGRFALKQPSVPAPAGVSLIKKGKAGLRTFS